jgi:endonuclease YncB( thermonuclease family)
MLRTLLAAALAVSLCAPASAMSLCGSGKRVTCVVDGDTFWLQGEKIRIEGLDAPEISQPQCSAERALGNQARDTLLAVLNSGDIAVERHGEDRYGRTLADVYAGGVDVTAALISAGVARPYEGRRSWCN